MRKKRQLDKQERSGYLNRFDHARKRRILSIAVLGILTMLVITYLVTTTMEMKKQDAEATKQYVEEYSDQRARMIYNEISSGQAALINMKESIEAQDVQTHMEDYLERKRALYGMDFIALYQMDSDDVLQCGVVPEGVDPNGFKDEMFVRQQENVEECEVRIQNGRLLYAVDLYQNEKQKAVLIAGCVANSLQGTVDTVAIGEHSSSYVIDKNNNVLIESGVDEHLELWEYVFRQGNDRELMTSVKTMARHLRNEQCGVFPVDSYAKQKHYLAYAPIGVENWAAVTIVPSDLFTGFSDRYVEKMLISLFCVALLFVAYLLLLFKNYSANERQLKRLAFLDDVTGGMNKIEFRFRYKQLCRKQVADQYVIALMDVVDFKFINKSFGMQGGDKALKYFYNVIIGGLKTEEGEFAARTEMDRFFLCMKERNPQIVQKRLDEIIAKINADESTELPHFIVRFRLGVSFVEDNITAITDVQDRAIFAMKTQDEEKSGSCAFYDAVLEKRMREEREVEGLFEEAIGAKEFQIYMQPKVSLTTGRIRGAEALVRWIRPGKGVVPPNEFIPILESSGKIKMLDRYVFEQVCFWLQKWKQQGKVTFPISVNLSRSNFLYDDVIDQFADIAKQYGVDARLIEFEVTETVFLDEASIERAKQGIEAMHQYGFRCALDDFGVGFSSLTMLREFDIDVLKMDRSFFLDLDSEKARDVILCVTELAEKLNIETVAEGIETQEQIEHMKGLRGDIVQGYYFSKPLPLNEFEEWIDVMENKVSPVHQAFGQTKSDFLQDVREVRINTPEIPVMIKIFLDALWEYDVQKEAFYVYHDSITPQLCDRWTSIEEIFRLYREKYVYEPDIELWDHFLSPQSLRRFLAEGVEMNHFYIRFRNDDGEIEWHEAYMERRGKDRLLLGSRDVKEDHRNAAIARAVIEEFDYVCCIDVATEGYAFYYLDETGMPLPERASYDYHWNMEVFNREHVVKEEVEELIKNMRIEHVLAELETKEEYILRATMQENSVLTYKKLCFRYADNEKKELLLTRIDISDLMRERQLREQEEKKVFAYLENLPVAFCSTEVLLDENKKPRDFRFTYMNRAHAQLEGVKEGELLGKNFYEFFADTNPDPVWLQYYYETAYLGIPHVIRRYSPEVKKHLLIHTICTQVGHCDCVVQDVSEEYFLTQELERSRQELQRRAQTDLLTEVFNAGTGKQLIREHLERKEKVTGCNAMFLMDIDDFKSINDENGHIVGDQALELFAAVLRKTFRSGDVIYRLGGDEFGVFVPDLQEPQKSIGSIMQRFSRYMDQAREKYPFLHSSVGIYLTDKKHSFEHYYAEADKALYQTKNQGKNNYTVRKDDTE